MGNDSYYIVVDEVDRMKADYLTYEGAIGKALDEVAGSVKAIAELDTFRGASAQSIKSYFQEVHLTIVDMINRLSEQLETDCSKEYSEGFFEPPVSAGSGACLPEQEMKQIEKSLQAMVDGDLSDASKYVQTAIRCLPTGLSFSTPSPAVAKSLLEHEKSMIQRIRKGARDLEDKGYAALTAKDGAFGEALTALNAAISACASGAIPVATYSSGGFASIVDSTGLRSAYEKCVSDQAANRDKVMYARDKCLDREEVRIKEAEEKAAREKAFWCGIGLIASVVVLAVGIATVATAGAAAPLLLVATGMTTYKSATNTFSRASQLGAILGGKAGADQDDYKWKPANEVAGTGSKIAKRSDKFDKAIGSAKAGDSKAALKGGFGLVKGFGGDAIDAAFDYVKDSTNDESLKTGVDITNTVVDEAYGQVLEGKFDGLGVVSTAGKATEAIADYFIDKADHQLEELDNRSQAITEIRENSKFGSAPAYSSIW